MRYVVDCMNVIGSRPDGWWRDREGAMRRFVEELHGLAHGGDEVVVVLDADPFTVGEGPARVEFAGRAGADDAIVRIVEADGEPASLHVVTSDRELAERVAARGAQVTGVRRFREQLGATAESPHDDEPRASSADAPRENSLDSARDSP